MKLIKHFLVVIYTLLSFSIAAQDFNVDDQYQQAMENAKIAFEANQYSQAVMFYREALSIKSDALLPKYKIEDIRTIYIKKELDSLQSTPVPVSEKPKKKKKKEVEAEQVVIEQKAEVLATQKMNHEADLAKQELELLVQQAEILEINDKPIILDEENIQDLEPNRETSLSTLNTKTATTIDNDTKKEASELTVETQIVPVVEIIEDSPEPEQIIVEEHVVEDPKPEPVVKTVKAKPVKKPGVVKNEAWIQEETKRLAEKYPNKKTVEEIESPGKHITRVIMNINGKISTYLKVKHSWGATYFFIDEVGLELRSISHSYFNLMTDLTTYKN